MKTRIKKEATVERMVESLKEQLKAHGLTLRDLAGLTVENFNTKLDETFNDGGEVRCEHFGDLAFEYALQFGAFESDKFDKARWSCVEAALEEIVGEIDSRGELQRCKHCGCYIDRLLADDSPGEQADHSGHKDDPRSPGDYDDVCSQCNYGEGKPGGPRFDATYDGDGSEWD